MSLIRVMDGNGDSEFPMNDKLSTQAAKEVFERLVGSGTHVAMRMGDSPKRIDKFSDIGEAEETMVFPKLQAG